LAEKLLREAYEEATLQPPDWIKLRYTPPTLEELEQEVIGEIRAKLLDHINTLYSRHVGRMTVVTYDDGEKWVPVNPESVPLEKKVEVVVSNHLSPFMIPGKDGKVYITREIIDKLGLNIDSLKSLAALLGWTYISKKSFKIGKKTLTRSVIAADVQELVQFLRGEEA
jgi:hypothetical protein